MGDIPEYWTMAVKLPFCQNTRGTLRLKEQKANRISNKFQSLSKRIKDKTLGFLKHSGEQNLFCFPLWLHFWVYLWCFLQWAWMDTLSLQLPWERPLENWSQSKYKPITRIIPLTKWMDRKNMLKGHQITVFDLLLHDIMLVILFIWQKYIFSDVTILSLFQILSKN